MTQQLTKQQGSSKQSCQYLSAKKDFQFDALSFEIKHDEDFQKSQSYYTDYEVDSIKEDLGELFRVWNGKTLLGTFYETSSGWKATPFYSCRQYIRADIDFSKTFDTSDSAVSYIKQMYSRTDKNFSSEKACLAA